MRRPDSNPLDAIPEEILVQGASEFGEVLGPIAANDLKRLEAIREAGRFSLLQRDPDAKTLSIHRLLQEVLQWPLCARLLPHALICAALMERRDMVFTEAGHLLNQTGHYLYERAQYAEAEPPCQRALAIREQALGANHPSVATVL